MSTVGTSVVIACNALISALAADLTLATDGVNVSYDAPVLPTDLKTEDGAFEAIWLGDAEESEEIPVLTAGHLHRDETIDQVLVIQVLRQGDDGADATQAAVDARAVEILGVRHEWLGFVDSGLPEGDPPPPLPEGCFALEPLEVAAAPLVRLVRRFRPHVMTTYDENGGYPHPDHIRCHQVSVAAFWK